MLEDSLKVIVFGVRRFMTNTMMLLVGDCDSDISEHGAWRIEASFKVMHLLSFNFGVHFWVLFMGSIVWFF